MLARLSECKWRSGNKCAATRIHAGVAHISTQEHAQSRNDYLCKANCEGGAATFLVSTSNIIGRYMHYNLIFLN